MSTPGQYDELIRHLETVAFRIDEKGDIDCVDQGAAMAGNAIKELLIRAVTAEKRVQEVEAVVFNDLLLSLDAQYKHFCAVRHTSVWGGSFEREHGAAMEIKPIVNKMFDTLIKLLEARKPK